MTTCYISLPILANKRSDWQLTNLSHKILFSNGTKSRFPKEVRFDTSTEIHLFRYGISDSKEHSQGTSRQSRNSYSDYQNNSFSDSSFSTNFPFSFGQTQCSSRQFYWADCIYDLSKCACYWSGNLIFFH